MSRIKALCSGVVVVAITIAGFGSACWGVTVISSGQTISGAILLASGLLCVAKVTYGVGEWVRNNSDDTDQVW